MVTFCTSDSMFNEKSLIRYFIIFLFQIFGSSFVFSQELPEEISNQLNINGEVQVAVPIEDLKNFPEILSFASPAKTHADMVTLFVTESGYGQLLAFSNPVYIAPNIAFKSDAASNSGWSRYPTYDEYIQIINDFAASFPDICRKISIGSSVQGREIVALKISENVNENHKEPEILYTATMHGNETAGYNLMLRLIDHLLSHYKNDSLITRLLRNTEIYINPVSNPDGLFYVNNAVTPYSKRFNVNNIDLNRNFPDPELGVPPNGQPLQPENIAMIDFLLSRNFVLAANFHSGVELVNYPWDTWERRHPDNNWYMHVSHSYADTVILNSSNGYFQSPLFPDGVINGYDWYRIAGSRQDYMNYFIHAREVTIELHESFITPENQLDSLWQYNKQSMLEYMQHVYYGFQGAVTDTFSDHPLLARIDLLKHDADNSHIYSDHESGDFYRLVAPGTYDLHFSKEGYFPKTIKNKSLLPGETVSLEIDLTPLNLHGYQKYSLHESIQLYPVPANDFIQIITPSDLNLEQISIYSIAGLPMNVSNSSLRSFNVDISNLVPGIYIALIRTNKGLVRRKFIKTDK